MHAFPILLAADLGDILRALIPIVMLVIYVVSQVMAGKGKAQPGRRQPPRQRPRVQPDNPQPARGDVANEIEDFLKKAAERREGQRPNAPAAPAQAPRRPAVQKRPRELPREGLTEIARGAPVTPAASPLPRSPGGLERPGEGVAASVQQHLDSRKFADRAAHLTTVDAADKDMADHLSQVFGRSLGGLGSDRLTGESTRATDVSAERPDTAPRAALTGVALLLADRQNLQSAIVLNEILKRPDQRMFDY